MDGSTRALPSPQPHRTHIDSLLLLLLSHLSFSLSFMMTLMKGLGRVGLARVSGSVSSSSSAVSAGVAVVVVFGDQNCIGKWRKQERDGKTRRRKNRSVG